MVQLGMVVMPRTCGRPARRIGVLRGHGGPGFLAAGLATLMLGGCSGGGAGAARSSNEADSSDDAGARADAAVAGSLGDAGARADAAVVGAGGDAGARSDASVAVRTAADMVAAIRTEQDPAYVYELDRARFVPPPGKTLLIVGQTLGGIDEHVASFPRQPLPGGWAAYWGIPSLDGVNNTFRSESGGRQNHQALVERFDNTVLQSGLWMVGTWDVAKKAGDGAYDQVVRDFSAWAQAIDRPIYLRIGYEFDGPHNELDPAEYIRAYRRIVDIMRSEGVENVAFVWHSYASPPYRGNPVGAWYPGDDYVDWVGISLFGHMYSRTPSQALEAVFDFARQKRKPVMVAEASPTQGISAGSVGAWDSWFVNLFSLAYARNIKAISFINEDWERFNFPGIQWRDARLQNNAQVAAAWFLETSKARYLKQSPDLFEQLGYVTTSTN